MVRASPRLLGHQASSVGRTRADPRMHPTQASVPAASDSQELARSALPSLPVGRPSTLRRQRLGTPLLHVIRPHPDTGRPITLQRSPRPSSPACAGARRRGLSRHRGRRRPGRHSRRGSRMDPESARRVRQRRDRPPSGPRYREARTGHDAHPALRRGHDDDRARTPTRAPCSGASPSRSASWPRSATVRSSLPKRAPSCCSRCSPSHRSGGDWAPSARAPSSPAG